MTSTEFVRSLSGPHGKQLAAYIAKRYDVTSYGVYAKSRKAIMYSPRCEDEARKKGNHRRRVSR